MAGPMDKFVQKRSPSRREKHDSTPSSTPCKQTEDSHKKRSPKLGQVSQQIRRASRESLAQTEREKYMRMGVEEKRRLYKCGSKFVTLDHIPTWPEYLHQHQDEHRIPVDKSKPLYQVNSKLNSKVSIWQGDITKLEIGAIINAANNSLLGGGGVDGAIHSAAGGKLRQECSTLGGCDTGDAKISAGYKLPAKYVIHTVGPMGEREKMLKSAYKNCLKLVKDFKLNSAAFPCISTGIYGYPNDSAAHIAIEAVRNFLEDDGIADKVERLIFCLFLPLDVRLYEEFMPVYFPVADEELDLLSRKNKSATSEAKKTPSKTTSEESQSQNEDNLGQGESPSRNKTSDHSTEEVTTVSAVSEHLEESSLNKRCRPEGGNSESPPTRSPESKKKVADKVADGEEWRSEEDTLVSSPDKERNELMECQT